MIALALLVWLACAVAAHGLLYASFQREFSCVADRDRLSDFWQCVALSLVGGPLTLIASLATLWSEPSARGHGFLLYRRPGAPL